MSEIDERIPNPDPHDYISTACQHRLHARCRLTCKFCGTPCSCAHHREEIPVEQA